MNLAGVRFFFRALLFHREFFTPHLAVKDINYVDFSQLHQCGIRYLVFDKDNTLTRPYKREIEESVRDTLNQCLLIYGTQNVAILSNSVGSSDDKDHKVIKYLIIYALWNRKLKL